MIIYNYLFGIRVNILHSPTPPPWGRVAPQTVEVQRDRGGLKSYKKSKVLITSTFLFSKQLYGLASARLHTRVNNNIKFFAPRKLSEQKY